MKISEKIYRLRTEKNLTQSELAKIAGVSDKSVSAWENGLRDPKIKPMQKICDRFGINVNAFIDESNDIYKPFEPSNALPFNETQFAPIVGAIPAGYPALALEDIEGYASIPYPDAENYFFLRVCGDSMINAGISNGDLVLIRKQSSAEDGQIVAARVNGDEATLKRFKRQGEMVLLLPENTAYDPRIVPMKDFELGDASIIGVAIEVRHML